MPQSCQAEDNMMDEPWRRQDFSLMSQSEQNTQLYKVGQEQQQDCNVKPSITVLNINNNSKLCFAQVLIHCPHHTYSQKF